MLRRSQQQAQQAFAEMEAHHLWQAASVHKGARRIVKHWEARSFSEIQTLARQLQGLPNTAAFLMITEGDSLRLICTRSHDLEKMDANACLRAALGELGGRGGGTPTLAQGGAPLTTPEAALEVLNRVLADDEF